MSSGGARASRERPSNRRGRLSYLAVVAFAAIYLAVGFVQPLPFWVSAAVNVGIFVALGTGWLNEWISQH